MDADLTAFRTRQEAIRGSLVEALADELEMLADAGLASTDDGLAHPAGQLLELRPGAPDGIVARLLLVVEPLETAVLIAAATERDVLTAWYDQVVPPTYVPPSWSPAQE